MRTRAKRDWNEADIVAALEAVGVTVERLSSPGAPDLVTYRADRGIRLLEVKAPRGRKTPAQRSWKIPYTVVRSVADALAVYGVSMRGATAFQAEGGGDC